MLILDHIVIAAADLARGAAEIEAALGVPLAPGGEHAAMGTHNRLLSLGPEEYLEVIAVNPGAPGPDQPRWFGLDRFEGATRVTNWACRTTDLDTALASAPEGAGLPWDLERGDLTWRMAVPADGELPFDGLFPALLQWQGTAHPAPRLPQRGVSLAGLTLISPRAEGLAAALAPLISDPRIAVEEGQAPAIRVRLTTPKGPVTL